MQEYIDLYYKYCKLYQEGVVGVDTNGIQVREDFFFENFKEYKKVQRGDSKYPFEYSTVVDGVEIFCITK